MKIAVVEDEILIREGIRNLLEAQGEDWEFIGEAENGVEGLELIRQEKPDIVITDIRMPDMDGLEMLDKAKQEGIKLKAIVLSAYSEFEYARTAIKLGVTEYLLKPISIDEFFEALRHVRIQMEKENQKQPDSLGSLERVLGAVVYGQLDSDEAVQTYLNSKYKINMENKIVLLCIYLGNEFISKKNQMRKYWNNLLEKNQDLKFCILRAEYEQSMIIVIYHYEDAHALKRKLQIRIMQDRLYEGNIGFIEVTGIKEIRKGLELLYNCMDWGVTLGKGVIISYPEVNYIKTSVCVYPLELENSLKTELCIGDISRILNVVKKFQNYFFSKKVYNPKDIKKCHVRFLWAALNIMKEIDLLDYKRVDQQVILHKIMNARSQNELESIVTDFFEKIKFKQEEGLQQENLTVKRVKSMIHEYYQSGITLEEIAQKLDVTPEYLSSLFHRSVGQTFTNYMKDYRIGKAKELLIGTPMKLFEIAQAVGYTDGKYFSKVLKEREGCLPAPYRRMHK